MTTIKRMIKNNHNANKLYSSTKGFWKTRIKLIMEGKSPFYSKVSTFTTALGILLCVWMSFLEIQGTQFDRYMNFRDWLYYFFKGIHYWGEFGCVYYLIRSRRYRNEDLLTEDLRQVAFSAMSKMCFWLAVILDCVFGYLLFSRHF